MGRKAALVLIPLLAASSGILSETSSGSPAPSGRATITGNVPPWATSANFKGEAAGTDAVGFRVYLGWQNQGSLEALAAAVSDPASPEYGRYLTPEQFRQQFAPPQASVGAVESWLRSEGFNIVYTPQNNHYVSAEGTVAQAATAFATSFGLYTVQGVTLRAPTSDPSVPASLAGMISGVIGLDQTAQLVHLNIASEPDAPPTPAFVSAQPCSSFWGEKLATPYPNPYDTGALPYTPCGYSPAQIKGAYGITGFDGTGQTVAIIDAYASPTILNDVNTWSRLRGLPTMTNRTLVQVVAPGTYNHPERGLKQDPQGWYGEETLDVEAVHGMAPGAKIVFVGAPNNFQDLDAALNHVVDEGLAQIVSNSYGFATELLPFGFIKPYEDTILQGAVEGIGIYFSSGDNSDESALFGFTTTDWPASSPFVTAVGGTSLAVGASNNHLFETGWGTRRSRWVVGTNACPSDPSGGVWNPVPPGVWLYGAGGGVSRIFAEPAYQVGVVPASVFEAQGRTGRAVPDISAFADPNTGYMIGQTQTFPDGTVKYSEFRIGGTSLSCPIMAGVMALADQAKGSPHGFANPAIYGLAGSNALNDIVDPPSTVATVRADFCDFVSTTPIRATLRTMNQTLSLHTMPGWDDVTGVGTPTGSFISALNH